MSKPRLNKQTNQTQLTHPPTTQRKKILVVGDWVVDEHWVTSIHRSKTRSRTGISHHRSIQEPDGSVITLAGAGKTTSILYDTVSDTDEKPKRYELIGLGEWHTEDEATLAHLLTPGNAVGQTHHRLTYPFATQPNDVRLYNFGRIHKNNKQCMTTRVIRIYQQEGSKYVLLDRIDWELSHLENRKPDFSLLDKNLAPHLKGVDAVIIKDMAKGVVNGPLITWLCKKFGQVKGSREISRHPAWFISSKKWLPEWRYRLPNNAVRLFIVPQVAAHATYDDPDFSRWITGHEEVTNEALDNINKLADLFRNAMICILPKGLSVLVRANTPKGAVLFKQPVVGKGFHAEGMPMASVFLPTLVSLLLEEDASRNEDSIPTWVLSKEQCQTILASALSFTEAWMRQETGRITESKKWQDNSQRLIWGDDGLQLPKQDTPDARDFRTDRPLLARWTNTSWDNCTREWEQAYKNLGVIFRETKEEYGVLEIQRAMVEVDGYVCCVETKRKVLRQLTAEIQSFDPEGNSKAFMLKASPGAGKSYLVKKLAESHGLDLLQFNITSLLTRNDLLDCFDTIVTTQARARHMKYLVFFDEINSDLEGHPVYDAFLRPLEEGLYVRAGKSFYIGPCIWVFAGTRDPNSEDKEQESVITKKGNDFVSRQTVKGTDFVSRLTVPPLLFDYDWTLEREFRNDELERLENVYSGAALLKRQFPDVTHVSGAVLEVFRVIPPKTPVRKIDRFVKRFDEIQYGKVLTKNLPIGWERYMDVSPMGERNWKDNRKELNGRMIKIV
jgi:hypothetical protein